MDLSKARAHFGLSAKGTGTRQGVTWSPRLGVSSASQEFPDSDVIFTFLLTGITSLAVPSLDLSTGAVTPDGVTVDGGTTDFEKSSINTIASIQAVLFERLDAYPGLVSVTSDADSPHTFTVGALEILPVITTGAALFTDPVADAANLSFAGPVNNPPQPITLRVTVLGTLA